MPYREPLPPDCPPAAAQEITEQMVRYRLLAKTAPIQADFDSYVKIKGGPNPQSRRTACEQSGLSVYTSLPAAQKLMTSDFNKGGRWQSIGELTIMDGAGKVNPVEPDGHQTWWPSKVFDPVPNCKVIA